MRNRFIRALILLAALVTGIASAQQTNVPVSQGDGHRFIASLAATTVPASPTDMLTINTAGYTRIYVQLTVGANALTGFRIKAQSNGNQAAAVLYSSSADYTTPKGILIGTSADLTTLAVGTGWFIMDVKGLSSVTINATSGGAATLAIEAGGASL